MGRFDLSLIHISGALEQMFRANGFTIAQENEPADVFVVNSCTVTNFGAVSYTHLDVYKRQALDIGAVHIDHHAGHKAGANGAHQHITSGIALQGAVNDGQYRVEYCHGHAAQRHHAGGNQAHQKDNGQKRQQHRLDGQNGTCLLYTSTVSAQTVVLTAPTSRMKDEDIQTLVQIRDTIQSVLQFVQTAANSVQNAG